MQTLRRRASRHDGDLQRSTTCRSERSRRDYQAIERGQAGTVVQRHSTPQVLLIIASGVGPSGPGYSQAALYLFLLNSPIGGVGGVFAQPGRPDPRKLLKYILLCEIRALPRDDGRSFNRGPLTCEQARKDLDPSESRFHANTGCGSRSEYTKGVRDHEVIRRTVTRTVFGRKPRS